MPKIAAVDDNEDVLFTIKYGIGKSDPSIEVVTFSNPDEFIKRSKTEKFDLILLDIMMPEIDGWDVFAEVNTTDSINKGTPILFLTAKTDDQSKRFGSYGAKDYITKPFTIPQLVEKIKQHI